MHSTKQKKLTKKILASMFSLAVFCGGYGIIYSPTVLAATPARTAQETPEEQLLKLQHLKQQVREAREALKAEGIDDAVVLPQKKTAEPTATQRQHKALQKTAKEMASAMPASGDTPTDFVQRVQNIINSYHADNPYARFLKQPSMTTTQKKSPRTEPSEPVTDLSTKYVPTNVSTTVTTPVSPKMPAVGQNIGQGGRYNFDWRGTPLAQSIYGVAKIAGKGVVVNGEVEGNVFMSLKGVTCDQAMNYLASAFGLNWMSDGNNLIVSTDDKMLQSQTFPVNYANKDTVAKEFEAIGIDSKNIVVNPENGTISVSGTPYEIAEAQKRLKAIDKPISQCLLLAQMIEINHGKDLDLGFSYTLPTYSHEGNETGDGSSLHGNWIDKLTFSASSTASRELSKGKVIARPMVLALNGQKGTVNFGDRVPVLTRTDTGSTNSLTVSYEDIGTTLEVTPIINSASGDITLNVKTEISNITGWTTSQDTRAPQVSTRSATTSVHVKSGQSFVIGGLMSQKDLDSLSGIPGLMNLPILGELFKYHSHSKDYTEVYIMLTPFILDDNVNARELYDELKYIDKTALKGDGALPTKDWAKSAGKHKIQHVDPELAQGEAY